MPRGRKPQATAEKEAKGAFDRHPERRNHNEPKAERKPPEKPERIANDPIASAVWDSTCKLLDDMKILTVADKDLIATYCENESFCDLMSKSVKELGSKQLSEKGTYVKNPDCIEWNKAIDRRLKIMAEIGLTPSSRARLTAATEEVKDPFTDFMERFSSAN